MYKCIKQPLVGWIKAIFQQWLETKFNSKHLKDRILHHSLLSDQVKCQPEWATYMVEALVLETAASDGEVDKRHPGAQVRRELHLQHIHQHTQSELSVIKYFKYCLTIRFKEYNKKSAMYKSKQFSNLRMIKNANNHLHICWNKFSVWQKIHVYSCIFDSINCNKF